MAFGPHLFMDCKSSYKLDDLSHIYDFLYTLPHKVNMTMITRPYVFPYEGFIPEDAGITGFTTIAESHISIHTFCKKDFFFVDVFSCKAMDYEAVKNYVLEWFKVSSYESNLIYRGKDFPR